MRADGRFQVWRAVLVLAFAAVGQLRAADGETARIQFKLLNVGFRLRE